jgi:hypothetical protein
MDSSPDKTALVDIVSVLAPPASSPSKGPVEQAQAPVRPDQQDRKCHSPVVCPADLHLSKGLSVGLIIFKSVPPLLHPSNANGFSQ